ncbi:hypothetical protein FEM48_Zijuj04G0032900 [Ziziphus jujuba var. spinosa]|uniref:RING-type E3 ubiquitin transferase n=1 Tax=Ziziphus jujuba var. spinosa TaxID=714518 RepID=A0A978VHI7_ZIZJJ|nr:hypothetical protein FEM48_Zijuj04G0032900 [Ziziphus jujuba var. spinosa]
MEFQEGLMKLTVHKPLEKQWVFFRDTETEKVVTQIDSPKRRWKLFHRSSSSTLSSKSSQPPREFLCPITGSLMAEPVIVSSGHTFESACVQVCKALNFIPTLTDNSTPDFSSVIPNLALKSTILSWCKNSSIDPPKPLDSKSAEKLVRTFMASQAQKSNTQNNNNNNNNKEPPGNVVVISEKELLERVKENPPLNLNHASTEVTRRSNHFYPSSDESIGTRNSMLPLPLATRPSCCSSSSSSSSSAEIEIQNPNSSNEEEEMLTKFRSPQVFEVEEALIRLRKITRTSEEARAQLCTQRLLLTLKSLILSRYTGIQVNSLAALVNLSLQKSNKVNIVRSGIVPHLVDALKGGSPEAQEHASGALFSLALNDDSKTAIGVLGALPPLLHLLRSNSERTRHDSALALYHLTLVRSNRSKLVKDGSIPVLLGMVRSGHMADRILLILCNLGSSLEGRVALLDAGAVDCLVNMLRGESCSESTRESCVAALYSLSFGGLRFKGLAKAAGAMEVLRKVERGGSERSREKARKIIEVMKAREKEEEEEVDWEALLESGLGLGSQSRHRLGDGLDGSKANSSEF